MSNKYYITLEVEDEYSEEDKIESVAIQEELSRTNYLDEINLGGIKILKVSVTQFFPATTTLT